MLTRIRRQHTVLPVFILTAEEDLSSKVELFALESDDYLIKPVHHTKLLARVAVQLRRFASDVVVAECEAEIKPDDVLNDGHRELVPVGLTVSYWPPPYWLP